MRWLYTMCRISIIIPIYNMESYLYRCLESVKNQSYLNWECIMVDDGSTDNSETLCGSYAERDARFILCGQTHRGVSAARNLGIRRASGDWILFLDADDFLEKECLFRLSHTAQETRADILIWNFYTVAANAKTENKILDRDGEYPCRTLIPLILSNGNRQSLACVYGRLFRRELLLDKRIVFPEGIALGEDKLFEIDAFCGGDSCYYLDENLYNRTLNPDSTVHRFRENAYKEYLQEAELIYRKLRENDIFDFCGQAFAKYLLQDLLGSYMQSGVFHPENKKPMKAKKEEFQKFLNEAVMKETLPELKYSELVWRQRIKLWLVRRGLVAVFCYRIRKKRSAM